VDDDAEVGSGLCDHSAEEQSEVNKADKQERQRKSYVEDEELQVKGRLAVDEAEKERLVNEDEERKVVMQVEADGSYQTSPKDNHSLSEEQREREEEELEMQEQPLQ